MLTFLTFICNEKNHMIFNQYLIVLHKNILISNFVALINVTTLEL